MNTSISNLKHLCTLLLAALAFAACSSDDDVTQEPVQPVKGDITFTAVFGVKNTTTRALTDPGNGTLTASWQQGEQIAIIFGGNKYVATVTAVDSEGSATVSATLPSGTPNNQAVTYIYPASAADGSGVLSDLLSSQDGTLATLSSTLDVATAEGTIVIDGTSAQPNGTVTLVNQFAVCKFQFKDENNQAITDITKLTITDLATTEVITVTASPSLSAVYVAMKPSNNSMKFVVECGYCLFYKKTANAHLDAGMFYHPTLQAICFNRYVDLDLPSGTLWAPCNIGATSPEEYGDYFSWGETAPKSDYSWSTYTLCNGSMATLTKYCSQSHLGYNDFTDNLTELETEDDVATTNWGASWQMPSQAQLQELYDNTTCTWTQQNGVNGRLFTASNGNSIFLPAAGYHQDTSFDADGSYGVYWSRSLKTDESYNAYYVYFGSDNFNANYGYRFFGISVRPVRKPKFGE